MRRKSEGIHVYVGAMKTILDKKNSKGIRLDIDISRDKKERGEDTRKSKLGPSAIRIPIQASQYPIRGRKGLCKEVMRMRHSDLRA